jgi:transcription-repair coupling factor (superfamily II helicase)
MQENELNNLIDSHPVLQGVIESVTTARERKIRIEGLSGSSKAMLLTKVFHKTQFTHIAIVPEKEDAAYLYNDLVSLAGEDSVFFFPSTYKRSVQYEQTEPANIVFVPKC